MVNRLLRCMVSMTSLRRRAFVHGPLVLAMTVLLSATPSAADQRGSRHLARQDAANERIEQRGAGVGAPSSIGLPAIGERSAITDAAGNRAPLPAASARPPATRGGGPGWTGLGPFGGDVAVAAFSPATAGLAFAGIAPSGTFGGNLYRSTDSGATWSRVPDLAGRSVFDVEIAASGKIYLATQDAVWTSENDGVAWTRRDLGIGSNQHVLDVELDPSDPQVVWAGVSDAGGGQTQVVLRSPDGGATWANRTPPLPASMSCAALAVRPGAPSTVVAVFAGSFGGGGVWVSTNSGVGWVNRSSGLPANPLFATVFAGSRLLVGGGLLFGSQFVGLYASDDLGVGWTPLHDGTWPLLAVSDVAVDPLDPDTLLVTTDGQGVNRTTDGGKGWEISIGGTAGFASQSVRFRPASSTDVLLGSSSLGVYRSQNGGTGFAPSSAGILELDVFSVDVNTADPSEIAVAFQGVNNGGIYSSDDGGVTWLLEPVPPTRYSRVRFAPGGDLYAVSSGPSTIAPEGLYRRNPDGSWTASLGPDQGPFFESDLVALRFGPSNPDLILLGGADFGVAGFESTIWRSTNAGANWTKEHEGDDDDFVLDIEIVANGLDQVMVASYDGFNAPQEGGVLRSVDGGQMWALAVSGLPGFLRFPRMCAPPGNPQVFFLAAWPTFSTGTLFRTVNGGATWSPTGWTGAPIIDVACDPHSDRRLYVVQTATTERVAASVDGGLTFAPYDSGLESVRSPRELAPAPTGSPRLLLASGSSSYMTELAQGGLLSDGFESGNTSEWSGAAP